MALLAVLKAGGAYVPLDVQAPAERLAQVCEDSGLQWLLSDSTVLPALPTQEGLTCLCLDRLALDARPPSHCRAASSRSTWPTSSTPPAPPDAPRAWR